MVWIFINFFLKFFNFSMYNLFYTSYLLIKCIRIILYLYIIYIFNSYKLFVIFFKIIIFSFVKYLNPKRTFIKDILQHVLIIFLLFLYGLFEKPSKLDNKKILNKNIHKLPRIMNIGIILLILIIDYLNSTVLNKMRILNIKFYIIMSYTLGLILLIFFFFNLILIYYFLIINNYRYLNYLLHVPVSKFFFLEFNNKSWILNSSILHRLLKEKYKDVLFKYPKKFFFFGRFVRIFFLFFNCFFIIISGNIFIYYFYKFIFDYVNSEFYGRINYSLIEVFKMCYTRKNVFTVIKKFIVLFFNI